MVDQEAFKDEPSEPSERVDDQLDISKKRKKKKKKHKEVPEEVEEVTEDEQQLQVGKKKKKKKHQDMDESELEHLPEETADEEPSDSEQVPSKKKKKKKKKQRAEEVDEDEKTNNEAADEEKGTATAPKKKKKKKKQKLEEDVDDNDEKELLDISYQDEPDPSESEQVSRKSSTKKKKKHKKGLSSLEEDEPETQSSDVTATTNNPAEPSAASRPGAFASNAMDDSSKLKGRARGTSSSKLVGEHTEPGKPARPSKLAVAAAAGINSAMKESHRNLDNNANLVQRGRASVAVAEEGAKLPGARPGLTDRAKSKQIGSAGTAKSSRSNMVVEDPINAKSKRSARNVTAANDAAMGSSSRKRSPTRLSIRTLEVAKLEEDRSLRRKAPEKLHEAQGNNRGRQDPRSNTKMGLSSANLARRQSSSEIKKRDSNDLDLETGLLSGSAASGTARTNDDSSGRGREQIDGDAPENLVQAVLVEEDPSEPFIAAAVQVDPAKDNEDPSSKPIYEHKHFAFVVCAVCCLLLVIVIVIAVVAVAMASGGRSKKQKGNGIASSVTNPPIATLAPTGISPDFAATQKYFETSGIVDEPNRSQLYNETSPYYKALHWIVYTDQRKPGADRIGQRFLLALLYYSTSQDGPWLSCNPPQPGNDDSTCTHKAYRGGGGPGGGGGGRNDSDDSSDVPGPPPGPNVGPPPGPNGRWLQTAYNDVPAVRWLSALDECYWAGIVCARPADIEVAELDLEYYQLSGALPDEVGKLPLKHLDLRGNRIRGSIPTSVTNWSKMRKLWLKTNDMVGSIPAEICNLQSLEELELSQNRLQGQLPSCLDRLSQLQELALNDNRLSGTIPDLGMLTSLRKAEFEDNMFTGSVPQSFCSMNLNKLNADSCRADNPRVECTCCEGSKCKGN